ncbi:selenocysteine-specific translation elongation factor [Alkalihalobacillus sp. AL-G]|uniref:selenocysteine-specific translation elongation factor n=1 Tax=Alkalihalobacillus sp. AL-G TaxID=2926399 RepID=UPI00272A00EE|nr:selenocysteine-specific translation elongation factor [Alkalihalobacillus sp. AL-G]WLD95264.1 selenocysteine-specific translation elongation factor [Alkalihalobacillus sp. AL-G]
MPDTFFTIGMAGHIDHGKTALTKALTNIDTDRLKEEKERSISIEPGFAPIELGDGYNVSIIDVPGHEKFIRQMIAGVAGIDLVILVVAGDEGVMPQTKEHVEILNYLGIEHAVITVTKKDKVDPEMLDLVTEDIQTELTGSVLEHAPLYFVDSISKTGIEDLISGIKQTLPKVSKRNAASPFRMPIDQSFTLRGKGAIVRGTVFDGTVQEGDSLTLLPQNKTVRVKQLQVHKQNVHKAVAGQRTAINLGGITAGAIDRGDILTKNSTVTPSKTIDLVLNVQDVPEHPLKQRSRVKFHTGTSEVMGTIVFFDRNELTESTTDEVLCQIRLDEPVAVMREDRFIVRRPSPVETIGGGWILNPHGAKYRFGQGTIDTLKQKKEGTPEERIISTLEKMKLATIEDISKEVGEPRQEIETNIVSLLDQNKVISLNATSYALVEGLIRVSEWLTQELMEYHHQYPMRTGRQKAEIVQELKGQLPTLLIEFVIEQLKTDQKIRKEGPLLSMYNHKPSYPEKWQKRFRNVVEQLKNAGIKHEGLRSIFDQQSIPEEYYSEFENYLLETGSVIVMEDSTFVHRNVFVDTIEKLHNHVPNLFTVQDAKSILDLSRKYCIMLLEKMDDLGVTVRVENERKWVPHKLDSYISRK